MLICGPSNSGKTNILLHMLYKQLEFDKIFLYSKNLHQNKYQALLDDFTDNIDPQVGYQVIEAPGGGDDIIPLEELPADNQKIFVFDDLVCDKNQNNIIKYFINCSVISPISPRPSTKVPKNIRENCSHICLLRFLLRENRWIADELGVDRDLLDRATEKKVDFLYYDKSQKRVAKNFDEKIG